MPSEFNMKDRASFLRLYYTKDNVIFELIKSTQRKEFVFLAPKFLAIEGKGLNSRTWRIHNLHHFKSVLFNGFRFANVYGYPIHEFTQDLVFNLYVSQATFINGLPMQNIGETDRNNEDFKKNCWKEIESFDFLIDIDADYKHKTIGWGHESVKVVLKLLDKFKIAYSFLFTGAGFQIYIKLKMDKVDAIKYSYNPDAEHNVYSFFTYVTKLLNMNLSEMIDIKVNTDFRRIRKLPYSISNYENAVYVCYPFNSMKEFLDFKAENYTPNNFIKNIGTNLGFCGLTIFNYDYDNTNEEKFLNMVAYLENMPLKRRKRGLEIGT